MRTAGITSYSQVTSDGRVVQYQEKEEFGIPGCHIVWQVEFKIDPSFFEVRFVHGQLSSDGHMDTAMVSLLSKGG
jgi:hypothetical protein